MARTKASIATTIWRNGEFLALSKDEQRAYMLLLSQPNLSLAGCLDMVPGRWVGLAADETPEALDAALDGLETAEFIVRDHSTLELLVRSFVRHDLGVKPNTNLVKGMWSAWRAILSPELQAVVLANIPGEIWARPDVPSDALFAVENTSSEPALQRSFGPSSGPRSEPNLPPTTYRDAANGRSGPEPVPLPEVRDVLVRAERVADAHIGAAAARKALQATGGDAA